MRKLNQKIVKRRRVVAMISMLMLGIIAVIFAIRSFYDLTNSIFGFVGIAMFVIIISGIGINRLVRWTSLKSLGSEEYVSLIIAIFVLITSIALLINKQVPIISDIATGSFLTGGAFIILEAFKFIRKG